MILKPFLHRFSRHIKNTKFFRWLYESHTLILLVLDRENYRPTACFDTVKINYRNSVEKFSESESWHNKNEMVNLFYERLDSGEILATLEVEDVLACYAWLNPEQLSAYFPLVRQEYIFPPDCSALYNVYTHNDFRGRGYYKQVLNGVINWVFDTNEKTIILTAIEAENNIALTVNQQMGFKQTTKLSYRCLFGRKRYSKVSF